MNKQYKIGDEVLVRGIVNSEVRNGGIHVLHDGVDAFYMLDQIHEPQKVSVPAFIDSYIRYAKTEGMSLFIAMDNAQNKESEWIITNEETFTRAWLDGYVVEKERRYTVEIPDPNRKGTNRIYLGKSDPNGKVFIHKGNFNTKKNKNLWLTEEEIKQDFEWAWQFRKEVE
ncbi:TPA: DUF1642 domain-containing protein [Streptococcus suis 14A]|uniref:DUF1642 domain-containing protein n=1 Tax=Streptococcus suis TaxID=1307 RepID=UPI000413A2DE|nr:DUF1642 domain-containing protein [Streptococcus suis]HEM3198447.1 DUF1642 domain-containing protein [Streptococcus suis 14A]